MCVFFFELRSLKLTASLPLKIDRAPKGNLWFHPSIFRGELLVLGSAQVKCRNFEDLKFYLSGFQRPETNGFGWVVFRGGLLPRRFRDFSEVRPESLNGVLMLWKM